VRRVLAVDPGLMTGMSCFTHEQGEEPILIWSAEVDEDTFATPVRHEFNQFPDLVVVCERFTITTQTGKNSQAPFSLELIGVLKQEMRDRGRSPKEIKLQKPVDAKNLFPNEALKKLGYWHKGGAGHANDSIRHGLLYLASTGWMPDRLLEDD